MVFHLEWVSDGPQPHSVLLGFWSYTVSEYLTTEMMYKKTQFQGYYMIINKDYKLQGHLQGLSYIRVS